MTILGSFISPTSGNSSMKILTILALLTMTGCATTDYELYSKGQIDIETARHNADAAKYKAMADIAATGSETAKVAAVMAMAMGQGGARATALQAPQASLALQWASILMPSLTNIVSMGLLARTQIAQSNNATTLGISTNSAFGSIATGGFNALSTTAGAGFNSATAIAGHIQAPAANITMGNGVIGSGTYTANPVTLSGSGVIGSGTYSTQANPITTTTTTTDRHDVTTNPPGKTCSVSSTGVLTCL